MPDTLEISGGVRIAWACEVVNVYQALFGYALDGDPACVGSIADRLRTSLPSPMTATESLYAAHQLVVVLECIGDAVHDRFHARFSGDPCASRPDSLYGRLAPGPALTVSKVIAVWPALFKHWFDAHHTCPPSLHAEELLKNRFNEPWTVASLAQTVGASRTRLLHQFEQAFGMPPAEYLARVRLREGLRRLRNPEVDVVSTVNAVGYRSRVKFAARLRRYTSHTPARIRRMPAADFETLLDERLRLQMF